MCTHLALLRCHITIHAAAFTDLRSTIYAADAIALTCSIHSFMAPYSRHHMHCHASAFTLHLCSPVHRVARAFFRSSDGAALMPGRRSHATAFTAFMPHLTRHRISVAAFTRRSHAAEFWPSHLRCALRSSPTMQLSRCRSACGRGQSRAHLPTLSTTQAGGSRGGGRAQVCVCMCVCVCVGGGDVFSGCWG